MADTLPHIPARPTIPTSDWQLLAAGCRDQDELRGRLAAYKSGWSDGQRSMMDALHQAMMRTIDTPQAPAVGLLCERCRLPAPRTINGLCSTCEVVYRPDIPPAELEEFGQ